MKAPSYRAAVEWIALNDDPAELRAEQVRSYISVKLVADLFGYSDRAVARAVVARRRAVPLGEMHDNGCSKLRGGGCNCSRLAWVAARG